jgi:hypothetical protein
MDTTSCPLILLDCQGEYAKHSDCDLRLCAHIITYGEPVGPYVCLLPQKYWGVPVARLESSCFPPTLVTRVAFPRKVLKHSADAHRVVTQMQHVLRIRQTSGGRYGDAAGCGVLLRAEGFSIRHPGELTVSKTQHFAEIGPRRSP